MDEGESDGAATTEVSESADADAEAVFVWARRDEGRRCGCLARGGCQVPAGIMPDTRNVSNLLRDRAEGAAGGQGRAHSPAKQAVCVSNDDGAIFFVRVSSLRDST